MPKKAEQGLRKTAERRGYDRDRTDRYVYGTLRKIKAASRRQQKQKR